MVVAVVVVVVVVPVVVVVVVVIALVVVVVVVVPVVVVVVIVVALVIVVVVVDVVVTQFRSFLLALYSQSQHQERQKIAYDKKSINENTWKRKQMNMSHQVVNNITNISIVK